MAGFLADVFLDYVSRNMTVGHIITVVLVILRGCTRYIQSGPEIAYWLLLAAAFNLFFPQFLHNLAWNDIKKNIRRISRFLSPWLLFHLIWVPANRLMWILMTKYGLVDTTRLPLISTASGFICLTISLASTGYLQTSFLRLDRLTNGRSILDELSTMIITSLLGISGTGATLAIDVFGVVKKQQVASTRVIACLPRRFHSVSCTIMKYLIPYVPGWSRSPCSNNTRTTTARKRVTLANRIPLVDIIPVSKATRSGRSYGNRE